ncbi:4-alpha-glucanotransferase [Budvicia aquatica]|uniref:4-alpha-glucanotransferase n=2 Tax=Budvicia aquatica TaxID=82979 RepID=A0A2C6DPR9_9GAMM|nr:4-alpha-glucanotransferase [Budvicia aquatica]GKX50429.1 4-alpha-glucanotransferase [Budvicia aquatica]
MDKLPPQVTPPNASPKDAMTLAGIATDYINAKGQRESITQHTRERLFAAMSASEPNSGLLSDNSPLPPVSVFYTDCEYRIPLTRPGAYQWHLQLEDLALVETTDTNRYSGSLKDKNSSAIVLPSSLPLGYHRLIVSDPHSDNTNWSCRIIIAPKRGFIPRQLGNQAKLWGTCIQLYTLRSATNWGIGDFSDLKHMLHHVARRGGAFVGLNPIHALYPANPDSASPYSPSSRNWLNVIYIDVAGVPEFQRSASAQVWWNSAEVQQRWQQVRQTDLVDYPQVIALKLDGLRLAYAHFKHLNHQHERVQAFNYFIYHHGAPLQKQAEFDALHAYYARREPDMWGWPAWPKEYQDGNSDAVRQFVAEHQDEVRFYAWLQWLAHAQLAECFTLSQRQGMSIGIYRDLAVGVTEGGSDTWCDKTLYRIKASIGAPPDPLGPLGQNWGLPPMDPQIMVQRAYQPFIDLLRSNMRYCGALRIDHVMSLLRLWWIPYGDTADRGGYVSYPVDDLLAILALESQRHKCMVIGEDLGIVPPEIVNKLKQSGVFSYKVLYFEQNGSGQFKQPEEYPAQAMATITTHDLPTLRSYWQSGDLDLGQALGLYPNEQVLADLRADRERCKLALLDNLRQANLIDNSVNRHSDEFSADQPMTPELNNAIHRFIASSGSLLIGLQPEDWLAMDTPVNVPGTTDQYPNWRRKLTASLDDLFSDPQTDRLLKTVQSARDNLF